ncbi:DUF308 domain-containing protein [Arenibaculum pallidiluteum]|uniref:DUF308 domain-containing protein n=1 Tax=Arenibaculum pallidiluteum TaxID=2812559 RepID=UPI001A96AD70|nr:DUF308 domain-containing protein [Arenibaculum pallidiluteum]
MVAGVLALLLPVGVVLAFADLVSAWAIVSGALMLAAAFRLRRAHAKWLLGLGGVLSLA